MPKCLFDTNFISGILKQNLKLIFDFEEKLFKNYQIIIPLITLAELTKTENLLQELIDFSKRVDVTISKPSKMLFEDEIQTFDTKTPVNIKLIDLTSSVLENENHMRNYFTSDEFKDAVSTLKKDESAGLNNIETLRKYNYIKSSDYVQDYLFTRLSIKSPSLYYKYDSDRNNIKLDHFQSIKFQGAFLFYKYIKKNIKSLHSDTFDALMIPTLPYVDLFVTERTNCGLLKELKSKEKSIKHLEILSLKDIRV